mgnify:CR=1 FL=1
MNEKQKWLDWAVELHRAAISAADMERFRFRA